MKKFISILLLALLSICSPNIVTMHSSSATVVYAEKVAFNTSTKKVHKLDCRHAKNCTVNCIVIERKDAYKRGGKPCKVCGG